VVVVVYPYPHKLEEQLSEEIMEIQAEE